MIKLLVDNRERAVIEHLDGFSFETVPLDVGDFQFWEDERLLMVIERKTFMDLAASIKDGRYEEQKFRLEELRNNTGCSVVYFIEGKKPRKNSVVSGIPASTLESALCSMFSSSGTEVITLENTRDCSIALKCFLAMDDITTVDLATTGEDHEMLSLIHKKLSKKKKNIIYKEASLQQAKSKKKNHMTFDTIFIQQLCMIHQSVSLKIAEKINELYGSWDGLLKAYEKIDQNQRCNMLKSVQVDERRKIGPAASKKVYEFCYGIFEKNEVPLQEQQESFNPSGVCLI